MPTLELDMKCHTYRFSECGSEAAAAVAAGCQDDDRRGATDQACKRLRYTENQYHFTKPLSRKPPTSLMRQPFAPADAAELLVASAALGLLD